MPHVAVYTRVSTLTQDTRSQERELKTYLGAYASGEDVRWYSDKSTGKDTDRPGWQSIEAAIARGEVTRLVVWRIDRLGRSSADLTRLFADLDRRRVRLESVREKLDLGTPAGRLVADVIASVAQYETEVRRERVAAGIAAAKASGKRWGGRKPGQRYKVDQEKERAIRRMLEAGATKAEIARQLGIARCTVYDVLRAG